MKVTDKLRRFKIDSDYLIGPSALELRFVAIGIAALCPRQTPFWTSNLFDMELQTREFHELRLALFPSDYRALQRKLPDYGLATDLLHDETEVFEQPGSNPLLPARLARFLGVTIRLSPRQRARKQFDDWRAILRAQSESRRQHLTKEEDAALVRATDFQDTVLNGFSIARRLRFIRVGLELAETEDELAWIATGPLEDAALSIRTEDELDDVEHELSLSPLLRSTCRELVRTTAANWDADITARWNDIVAEDGDDLDRD